MAFKPDNTGGVKNQQIVKRTGSRRVRQSERLSHPVARVQKERKGHSMRSENPLRRRAIFRKRGEGEDLDPVPMLLIGPLEQRDPLLAAAAKVGEPEDGSLRLEILQEGI